MTEDTPFTSEEIDTFCSNGLRTRPNSYHGKFVVRLIATIHDRDKQIRELTKAGKYPAGTYPSGC